MSAKERKAYDEMSESENNKQSRTGDESKLEVRLSRLSPGLKDRVERRISEFENESEPALLRGDDGVVPRIKPRDYVIEATVGILLTVYFALELFII